MQVSGGPGRNTKGTPESAPHCLARRAARLQGDRRARWWAAEGDRAAGRIHLLVRRRLALLLDEAPLTVVRSQTSRVGCHASSSSRSHLARCDHTSSGVLLARLLAASKTPTEPSRPAANTPPPVADGSDQAPPSRPARTDRRCRGGRARRPPSPGGRRRAPPIVRGCSRRPTPRALACRAGLSPCLIYDAPQTARLWRLSGLSPAVIERHLRHTICIRLVKPGLRRLGQLAREPGRTPGAEVDGPIARHQRTEPTGSRRRLHPEMEPAVQLAGRSEWRRGGQ
jgi:hypothetical protein